MKETANIFRNSLKEFWHHAWQYLTLFWGMSLLLSFVIAPLLSWLANLVIQAANIPYISYTNLGSLILTRPLGSLALLLLLILLLLIVYLQFAFQIEGVRLIQSGKASLKKIFQQAIQPLRHFSWQSFGFFIFYFLLILPFGTIAFSTSLLDKIAIPAFTMEFFYRDFAHFLILVIFYAVAIYLGTRLIFILPLTILKAFDIRKALRKSLELTRGFKNFLRYFLVFALINLATFLIYQGVGWLSFLLQTQFDRTQAAFSSALILLMVIELTRLLIRALASMLLFSFLIAKLDLTDNKVVAVKTSRLMKSLIGIFIILAGGIFFTANWAYLSGSVYQRPLTISHRGVDDNNGVQNTIPALEKTAKEKPDYVEMDIQETKDHQFVVMHDNNLANLAGVNKKVENMTLAELTSLTVHEHGMSAKIPSFDDYFVTAQKLHQKLLIEIKVNPKDSPDLTQIFLKKYSKQILANGDKVHSLDYTTVEKLKAENPKIFVSFILPVNFIFPTSHADAYTMEATTLDDGFVDTAQAQGKQVYAWTVNDTNTMREMMLTGVNGIITDNLSELKSEIHEYYNQPSYAQRLKMIFDEFSFVNEKNVEN